MLRTSLEIVGNILVLGLLFYSGVTRSLKHAIFTSLIPVLPYFFVAFRANKRFYLFCGSILLSLSYFLAVRLIPNQILWLILPFPLILGFFVSSYYARKDFSKTLEIVGHLNFLYLIIMTFQIQNSLNSSVILPLTMLLFAALYLVFARVKKDANLVLGGAIAFSLFYYFLLALLPEIISSKQLLFFSMISIIYIVVGFGISKRELEVSHSLYTAAVLIALFSSFSILFLQGTQAGSAVILIGALSFCFLLVLTRRSEYLYLVSLSLGFLTFRLLQVSGSEFVKELVDYFFYALLFLGLIFIFLFLKKRFEQKAPFSFLIITGGKGRLLLSLPIILLIALVFFVLYPVRVTMNPLFCGTCHNMKTAYETWENSVHGEVDCGKCHYLPGFKGFVKTKLGGLAESASYISGKYAKKTLHHPELSDKTCLGCHKREELFDADISYNEELPFDHEFHLTESPLDIDLTCANCHSQVNMETHFEINESTCLTCHNLELEDFDINEIEVRKKICDACHVAGRVEIGENIHDIHVKGQKTRCVACHPPTQEEKDVSD